MRAWLDRQGYAGGGIMKRIGKYIVRGLLGRGGMSRVYHRLLGADRIREAFTSEAVDGRWRLPTVPELMSLLRPNPHGFDFCVPPVFNRNQKSLWSSDRRSFTAAWFVDSEMGFVGWRDMSGRCCVCAVCSA